ncbi:hypothetical protein ACIRBX_22975 [Kitasatospora sp. NPDC096147]|uniref:hypothetical protein n=1 Tax=Kitasatospora sp. NPDC096147 TaxID=3364093 RepID=UPI00380B48B3
MILMPVTVPAVLIDEVGLDPAADSWRQEVLHAVGTPDGGAYVLSSLWRHDPRPAGDGGRGFGCRLITRHDPDGTALATAVLAQELPGRAPSVVVPGNDAALAVLPDGALAVSSRPGNTHLLTPALDALAAGWTMPANPRARDGAGPADDPFAASVAVTPGGRLLCLNAERNLGPWGVPLVNLVTLSEPAARPAVGHKPELRALATLGTERTRQSEADAQPHLRHGDAPVAAGHRPSPTLVEILPELVGGAAHRWKDAFLRRPVPIAEDRYVVPVFGRTHRAGSRGQVFAFVLLDDTGAVRGHLGGLDPYAHSPYTGDHFTVAADPARGTAFHLNRYGLFGWTADGALRAQLLTTDAPFKALTTFELLTVTPAGELLLAHRTQHLLLRVPVPAELAGLPAAVTEALAGLTRARNALKRRHAPVEWLWPEATGAVHHL